MQTPRLRPATSLAAHRRSRLVLAAVVVATFLGQADGNDLPVPQPTEPFGPAPGTAVAEDLRTGVELERSRRWADAIEFYEAALKRSPNDERLKHGLRRAEIHFGIARRYADASFSSGLLARGRSEASALWGRVRSHARDHYFEPVSATSLTSHGTESLYLALADPAFLRRNVPSADPARIDRLRRRLREDYWNRNVEGAGRPEALVDEVCRLCREEVGLSATPVILEYAFGATNALDDYSGLLTADRFAEFQGRIDGEFVGLGIEIDAEFGRGLRLVNVFPEGPAALAGLRPDEYLVSIGGSDCREVEAERASAMIRGPEGTAVVLQVRSPDGAVRRVEAVRRAVVVRSVEEARMLVPGAGIGYLRMTGFQKSTPAELDSALADLSRQGMRRLIWDLRGNAGGLLTTAVDVADRFLESGAIVSIRGRDASADTTYSARRDAHDAAAAELILLVDGDSASASEIVAAAIRDHARGRLVGRATFGKWCMQTIYPFPDGTALRLTTAGFYSPLGLNYAGMGLEPDLTVPVKERASPGRPFGRPALLADPDVRAALRLLAGGTAADHLALVTHEERRAENAVATGHHPLPRLAPPAWDRASPVLQAADWPEFPRQRRRATLRLVD